MVQIAVEERPQLWSYCCTTSCFQELQTDLSRKEREGNDAVTAATVELNADAPGVALGAVGVGNDGTPDATVADAADAGLFCAGTAMEHNQEFHA